MRHATVPDEGWVRDLGADNHGVRLHAWGLDSDPQHLLTLPAGDEVGLVVAPFLPDPSVLSRTAGLPGPPVVQLLTAGYEHAVAHLPPGVRLANAAGVHDTATAELALALILAAQRGIPDFAVAQRAGHWVPPHPYPALSDRRVLILGYGRIGRAVAARLLPFEVHVSAVASQARGGDELVERVAGLDELPDLLPDHDIVVLVVPLTASTRALVDAAFLAALPDGALVVNVSRGPVVDTEALLVEVASGRLRAALDVTDPEPLPVGHPLWRAPGVLISPHVGGVSPAFRPRMLRLLREQLRRYAAGEPLAHLVP